MPRGNGSYLGYIVSPTTSSAGGIWTTKEVFNYVSNGDWPGSGPDQTALLMHFDGDLTDSSTNNLSATQRSTGSLSNSEYKFGSGSMQNGYVSIDSPTSIVYGSSNWTIELWIKPNSLSSGFALISHRTSDTTSEGMYWYMDPSSGELGYFVANDSGGWQIVSHMTGLYLTEDAWNHVALVRNGDTVTCYLEGTGESSPVTISGSIAATGPFNIGAGSDEDNYSPVYGTSIMPDGYIDEIRVTIGSAIYTSNFSPPTSPF